MSSHAPPSARFRRRLALAIAAGALTLTSGCIHVSQRAIDNGRSMTSSRQYRDVLAGDRTMGSFKKLYYRSNARMMYARDLPFPLFGNW